MPRKPRRYIDRFGGAAAAEELFMLLSRIASVRSVKRYGPNKPRTLRSLHAVRLTMNEILLALGCLRVAEEEPTRRLAALIANGKRDAVHRFLHRQNQRLGLYSTPTRKMKARTGRPR